MPKCITFRANGGNESPTCPAAQAMQGYTVDDGQPPAGAKHIFAYTHGFCGPTGKGPVEKSEAAWCGKVAKGCGLSYPSAQWHGKEGAKCLVQYVSKHTPDGVHFEIDNCSEYKAGVSQCYEDLIAAMKEVGVGNRRLLIKNVKKEEADKLNKVFIGPDSKLVSNFVIVEEEFNKQDVQKAFGGTCVSVAQSLKTQDYKVRENHISIGGAPGAVADASGGRTPASTTGSPGAR
ncbi:MAG: hypothetical protein AB7F86_02420 [Bdellovibrionales bacterium]